MPHGVHAPEDGVQPAARDTKVDRVFTEAERPKLAACDNAVLPACQAGDSAVHVTFTGYVAGKVPHAASMAARALPQGHELRQLRNATQVPNETDALLPPEQVIASPAGRQFIVYV